MSHSQNPPEGRALSVSEQKRVNARLFRAIRSGDEPGVRAAIQAGADLYAVSLKRTPMERALYVQRAWNAGVIARLFEAMGAQTGIANGNYIVFGAVRIYAWELVRFMVDAGEAPALTVVLDLLTGDSRDHYVALIRNRLADGVSQSATRAIAPLVFETSSDVDERNDKGATWLHASVLGTSMASNIEFAAWGWLHGRAPASDEVVLLGHLLSLSPRVDAQWYGTTALHLAALHGCDESFARLLADGADCERLDGNERHILDYKSLSPGCRALVLQKRLQRELEAKLPTHEAGTQRRARM